MKKIIPIIIIILLFAIIVFSSIPTNGSDNSIKVLFIGNSLTSVNDLPGMTADIAESHGKSMVYESYAPGGTRLADHAVDEKALQKIKEGDWDFVVLQEQSQYPGFSKEQLALDVYPYAANLSSAVKSSNAQAQIVFYMTMAHSDGDPDNANVSPELLTYEGAQKRINAAYLEMAMANGGLVAPVGEVWLVVRQENPDLDLYADKVHPNKNGTYLAACVFYVTFFGEACADSPVPSGVDRTSAEYIQSVVDRIALNQ